jgi:hypothetical protein
MVERYSPKIPRRKICTEPKKKTPRISGARPNSNDSQNNSLATKYTSDAKKLRIATKNPNSEISRIAAPPWVVKPRIAMS